MLRMAGDAPMTVLSRTDIMDQSLVDLAVKIGAAKSKAECRRLIKGGGVYLNNERVESDALRVNASNLLDDKVLVVRIGRRNNFIVQVQ
ncbi:Tyrosine-tRNA ligase [Phytophthora palmivora]|uniref:Tyrosine-tRNA ligase n=1 Tax=Phytophthora palmivora TaxID=4796 RepID=A0A2P4Y2M2_9STRA|nr:Tyrosine-tRNA ligase [Phytophthora palmivora]